MAGNLIEVGAVFDGAQLEAGASKAAASVQRSLAQMQAAFDELKATTTARINEIEAKLAEMSEAHVVHGAKSSEAMHAMGLSMEATGITINRHMRGIIAQVPILSKAFEALFPVFALTAGIEILGRVGEKISELVADTFIYTEAEKNADKAIAASNVELEKLAAHTKAVSRERALAAAGSAKERTELKLKFAIEDEGAPEKLQERMGDINRELIGANRELEKAKAKIDDWTLKTGAIWHDFESAKERVDGLNTELVLTNARLKDIQQTSAQIQEEGKRDEQAETQRRSKEQAALDAWINHAVHAHSALGTAVKKYYEDQAKDGIEANLALVKSEQTRVAAIEAAEQAAAAEAQRTADEAFKGQIEKAKLASDQKLQLIEQDFLRGKINQQQEIAAIAQEKERELQIEKLAQQQRWALWDGDKKKQQQVQNEIDKIVAQAQLVETKAVTDSIKGREQQYRQLFQQIGNSFKTEALGVLQDTETIGQAFQKLYQSLLSGLADYIAQKAIKKAEELAIDKLFHTKSVIGETTAAAGKAMAAGFASVMAALPFPANVAAAPGVAAAAGIQATGFGLAGLASFDIGSNFVPMDGLAFLHEGERVIPASKQGPGYTGDSGGDVHVHFNLSAMDGASVKSFLRTNAHAIGNEVATQVKRQMGKFRKK